MTRRTPDNDTDLHLVQQLQHNAQGALAAIYEKYWAPLTEFCYKRLQQKAEAEEIVQEIFISLYERREQLQIQQTLHAYLFTAARYRIYNRYRSWMQQKKLHYILHLEDVDYAPAANELAEFRELEQRVENSLRRLPEKCREVFLLNRNDQLSYREIAVKLNISVNTVEKHMGKALRILRKDLQGYELLALMLISMNDCLAVY
ncbi:RNA polymerase sigma-70 factor [Chitinophaga cymbidii]|uniref:DNA-directed RNA polymerase sigma-70 factor n=1 Tax=Chitinophaga cymbidii TaxID=1096750 RepID=A0A512RQW6_9BACT|nr:RNA polymerase sigma-70 factor [Chitinophaga cymbidii]GEP98078.1 DNA-directed RNA polymerase sigma-70 factor [Chitinophaga cymbidii]